MTQTLAIFYDAYKDLSARWMFWIVLIITGLAIGAFGMLSVHEGQLSLFNLSVSTGSYSALGYYRSIFMTWVIQGWLTWIAIALALVSTAGIFPDLLSSGTIDLYLVRPISRLRFFATKYLSGLLFVALQVAVFALGSFLIFGIRAGEWNWAIFLAIPLVVCVFSYLFGVCVLFGVLMRSTISALLLTLVFWGLIAAIFWADEFMYSSDVLAQKYSVVDRSNDSKTFATIQRAVRDALLPMPKIVPTTRLLNRFVLSRADVMDGLQSSLHLRYHPGDTNADVAEENNLTPSIVDECVARQTGGNAAYTVGSSLIFEAVFLSLAAWIFCRRDY